jgi:hypothetical protein
MDENAILLAIGKLQGQMDGIGREIGDIKDMIGNNEKGLCGRLSTLEVHGARISQENSADIILIQSKLNRVESVQDTFGKVESEKKHWVDSIYAKIGAILTITLAIIGAIKSFR